MSAPKHLPRPSEAWMPMRAYMDVFTACLGMCFGADMGGGGTEKNQDKRKCV